VLGYATIYIIFTPGSPPARFVSDINVSDACSAAMREGYGRKGTMRIYLDYTLHLERCLTVTIIAT
jgi:hypothetical protein